MLGYKAINKKMLGYETKDRFCPNISSDVICVVSLDPTHFSK